MLHFEIKWFFNFLGESSSICEQPGTRKNSKVFTTHSYRQMNGGKKKATRDRFPFATFETCFFSPPPPLWSYPIFPQKRENCVPALLKIRFTAEQNKRLFLQALLHPFRETRMLWNSTEFQTRIQQKKLSVAPCKVVKCSAPPSSPNVSPSLFWRVTGLTAFLHLIAYLSLCNVPSYPQFH